MKKKMNIINIGASHEVIKNLKKETYKKQECFVVDDLSVLSSNYCKCLECEILVFCPSLIHSNVAQETLLFYQNNAKQCYEVSEKVFLTIAEKENCAGILIVCKKNKADLTQLKNKNFVLVLDGIEMQGNVGTIFRSCDATGVDMVVNTNVKANIYSNKVVHSSRGMVLKVPFVNAEIVETIEKLKENNFNIILCETIDGIEYNKCDYSNKIAIVVGSERFGIDKLWLEENTTNVFIPMQGEMKSLNVGVAASIVLYQALLSRK